MLSFQRFPCDSWQNKKKSNALFGYYIYDKGGRTKKVCRAKQFLYLQEDVHKSQFENVVSVDRSQKFSSPDCRKKLSQNAYFSPPDTILQPVLGIYVL